MSSIVSVSNPASTSPGLNVSTSLNSSNVSCVSGISPGPTTVPGSVMTPLAPVAITSSL